MNHAIKKTKKQPHPHTQYLFLPENTDESSTLSVSQCDPSHVLVSVTSAAVPSRYCEIVFSTSFHSTPVVFSALLQHFSICRCFLMLQAV